MKERHNRQPMNIKPSEGDMIREAINREEYDEHKALGRVDDYEILLVARVTTENHPKLIVYAGGEWDTNEHIYLGGSTITESFDSVWGLDEAFGSLVRQHDLDVITESE